MYIHTQNHYARHDSRFYTAACARVCAACLDVLELFYVTKYTYLFQ